MDGLQELIDKLKERRSEWAAWAEVETSCKHRLVLADRVVVLDLAIQDAQFIQKKSISAH